MHANVGSVPLRSDSVSPSIWCVSGAVLSCSPLLLSFVGVNEVQRLLAPFKVSRQPHIQIHPIPPFASPLSQHLHSTHDNTRQRQEGGQERRSTAIQERDTGEASAPQHCREVQEASQGVAECGSEVALQC